MKALIWLSTFASILTRLSSAAHLLARRANLTPVITSDFPDPSIINVGDTWYAFASQSEYDQQEIKIQLATSTDFKTWKVLLGHDALRNLAPWVRASDPVVWAPSVSKGDDGKFLMYYSAVTTTAGNGRFHCVGTAVSDKVEGPYDSNADEPFVCPTDDGGALDASSFRDSDGSLYVLYKIDRNSLGHGGNCNNGVEPILKTQIMIQKVEADGTKKVGEPVELLDNSVYDGPLVEAPYMMRNKANMYVLFFSSNCYTTELYDTSYATSRSPLGPFEKTDTPLFVTGTQGLIGPGGASVAADGVHLALHGYAARENLGGRRAMYVTGISTSDRSVVAE